MKRVESISGVRIAGVSACLPARAEDSLTRCTELSAAACELMIPARTTFNRFDIKSQMQMTKAEFGRVAKSDDSASARSEAATSTRLGNARRASLNIQAVTSDAVEAGETDAHA